MPLRIGFGFDTHRLETGRKLILGGIHIPSEIGCLGHSDADVLIHAICDALLGAACLGDIGRHFPDTDPAYTNIDSTILLRKVNDLLTEKGYAISNIDCTIVLQKPKLAGFIQSMQVSLGQILNIQPSQVSIKAKTSEKLGFIGREEGVSAYAVTLLEKQ
ncbi:MAG: 2-C-methyl-D-erythritol 2,4-cyclodiphosphate synthase [Bacteroidetes bacterium]|nr:2-C-methyl-D-erythritol 2,4-cyclodiphosphate synthase [Bacteroidota bacterium]